jgi:hypothetical protein
MRVGALVGVLSFLLAIEGVTYLIGVPATAVLAVLVGALAAAALVRRRGLRWWRTIPLPLTVFLGLATVSLLWSAYPGGTAIGLARTWLVVVMAVAIAVEFTWPEIVAGLASALRLVLLVSWLFEIVVAVVIRRPVVPIVPPVGVSPDELVDPPKLLQWSRNELFELFDDGRLQGIVGNATIFAFLAILALAVFVVELLAAQRGRRLIPALSIALAIASLAATKSATVIVAGLVVVVLIGAALLVRRAAAGRPRMLVRIGIGGGAVLAVVGAIALREQLLGLLGRSGDLTGRAEIWATVLEHAAQRPVAGHGWIGYWLPWIEPFDSLVSQHGVRQLQAHSAWVDVALQLGAIGVLVFGALIVTVLWRAGRLIERAPAGDLALAALPLALAGILVAQSFAESRILVDSGLALLIVVAMAGAGAIHGVPGKRERAEPAP